MDYRNRLNVVLVEPEIPGNTGSIGRLCVGLNASLTLIEPLGFSLEDKYLKRAGLDYWPHLDYQILPCFEQLTREVPPASRFFFYSTHGRQAYTKAAYRWGDFLVFGKETRGLPKAMLAQNADQCYTIPMFGPIRSLNLAVTVGIVTYEATRQIKRGFSC